MPSPIVGSSQVPLARKRPQTAHLDLCRTALPPIEPGHRAITEVFGRSGARGRRDTPQAGGLRYPTDIPYRPSRLPETVLSQSVGLMSPDKTLKTPDHRVVWGINDLAFKAQY
jgi:hypothetical protein